MSKPIYITEDDERFGLDQDEAYRRGVEDQFVDSIELGPWTSHSLLKDPKHMCFVLSRYKFVAKMLEGKRRILEVGCGDGFGFPLIAQAAQEFAMGVDRDPRHIEGNSRRLSKISNIAFQHLDICETLPEERFDAAFSIDVIEHLNPEKTSLFLKNQAKIVGPHGIVIVGCPNVTADQYSARYSQVQHINMQSHESLKEHMNQVFENVFMFGMNDEVLHTGYPAMAHYLFAMGVGVKN